MPVEHLAPEIALVIGGVLSVAVALSVPRARQRWALGPLLFGALAAAVSTVMLARHVPPQVTLHGTFALDQLQAQVRLLLVGVLVTVALLSPRWFAGDQRHGEWYAMLSFATAGASLLAGAADVMELVVGMLLSSVTTYLLVAYHRGSAASVEAGIKAFLLGSLANVLVLLGAVLFYGLAGTTTYATARRELVLADPTLLLITATLLVVGLTFKVGAVPIHTWVPDAAQGAPAPGAAFVTVAPKIGAVIALVRLASVLPEEVVAWRPLIAVLAAVTMTVGNLAALWQEDLRRLLGWSSVSQAGYALMAPVIVGRHELAASAALTFLAAYAIAQLAAFGVVVALRGRTRLEDYSGLLHTRPALAVVLVLALLSLVGIPPTAGFAGKLGLFAVTVDVGYGWLAAVAVVNTVISLFYYLRVIAPVCFEESRGPVPLLGHVPVATSVVLGGVTLLGALVAQPLLQAVPDLLP